MGEVLILTARARTQASMGEAAYTRVTILGEEYRITGETSGTVISELAAFIDNRMDEVKRHSSTFDLKRIAVLTALNLADELLSERARNAARQGQVRERVARLGFVLEETLADPGEGTGSLG